MNKRAIKKVPIVIGLAVLGGFAFGMITMLLWNGVLAPVLHISAVTFWQALGILLLAKILFGGFRGRRWHGGWRRTGMPGRNMTGEEWKQFAGRCRAKFQTAGE